MSSFIFTTLQDRFCKLRCLLDWRHPQEGIWIVDPPPEPDLIYRTHSLGAGGIGIWRTHQGQGRVGPSGWGARAVVGGDHSCSMGRMGNISKVGVCDE